MKLYIFAATTVAVLLSVDALAEIDEALMAEFESDCNRYAQEKGVTPEDLEGYLTQCVQDLLDAQPAGDYEPAEEEGKQ